MAMLRSEDWSERRACVEETWHEVTRVRSPMLL